MLVAFCAIGVNRCQRSVLSKVVFFFYICSPPQSLTLVVADFIYLGHSVWHVGSSSLTRDHPMPPTLGA